jgi:RimJ/RimL family protein N-acetyltransferase
MEPPFALEGEHVTLLPLGPEHVDALLDAATDDRTTFGWTPVPWDRPSMEAYVAKALAKRSAGEQVPFATRSVAADRIVGSTRFYDITTWDWSGVDPRVRPPAVTGGPDVVAIGSTWLHPAVQRTAVNTEAKRLMLGHAFETWGVRAVRFHTDARNTRSRAAIERLGCTLDGVLRIDRPASDGTVRDTAVFTMAADEWPAHRARLDARLGR